METQSEIQETGCCPKFDPAPWHEKTIEWDNRFFVKDHVCSLFYMALNFSQVMKRMEKMIKKADAKIPDNLCLSDHTSKWNIDVFLAVDKEIPEAENISISGKFLCKVYEGPYSGTRKWTKDFEAYAKSKGENIQKYYIWYTTCPKCAKAYNKNYVVILGKI